MFVSKRAIVGRTLAVVAALMFCLPVPAFAVSMISATPGGDGVFLLQGIGVEDAAALEITVQYDSATLANPRVVEGPFIAGSMTAVNPNIPGAIRIVAIRLTPIRGSGLIATMTFDLKGSSPGKIISLTAKLANVQGTNLPVLAQISAPSDTPKKDPAPQSQESTAGTAASSQPIAPPIAPAIIIAGPSEKLVEAKGAPDLPASVTGDDRSAPKEPVREPREEPTLMAHKEENAAAAGDAAARAKTATREIYLQKSVLDRFHEYKGERTADAFVSLFNQENVIGCRQEPPVVLSDGKTKVIVTFISPPGNLTSSDVAVMGAQLLSLSRDPDNTNTWIATLLPKKGEYKASIAVLQGEMRLIHPLTIAPKINMLFSQAGQTTNSDFNRYLAEKKIQRPSGPDVNHDGKWDYLDDYILTANYLFANKKTE
jgi:hypothetical protein